MEDLKKPISGLSDKAKVEPLKSTTQAPSFISLKDIKKEHLSSFIELPVILEKGKTNKGRLTYSIKAVINSNYMPELVIKPNGSYLTADIFNELLLNIKAPIEDERGYTNRLWRYNIKARFVKGLYTNQNGEYYSLELLFKEGVYFTHFFDTHQTNILKSLIKNNELKAVIFERPEKIDKIEAVETLEF